MSASSTGPAERTIVISPRKSGTHLVQKLMALLGFGIYGEPIPAEEGRAAFSLRERLELAERYLDPDELSGIDVRTDTEEFLRRTDLLLAQVGWIWQVRLAARNVSNVDLIWPEAEFTLRLQPDAWTRPFSETPPRLCWIFHAIDIWRADQRFLQEWSTSRQPLLILNYRDPRDALVSMVNFFGRANGLDFLRFPEWAIFRPILENMPDMSDRLTYMLRDPAIPLLADYESAISLWYHPHVCKVSFENLVGPAGGGSSTRQKETVQKVTDFVGAQADHNAIAGQLFDPSSFTFYRGSIGAWREVFKKPHEEMFQDRFGHLLEVFGYEWC